MNVINPIGTVILLKLSIEVMKGTKIALNIPKAVFWR